MRTLRIIFSITAVIIFAACNGTNKTGGATRDSSASYGYSGASDSSGATGSGSAIGTSSMGTDTSKTGKPTVNPTVDSGKAKP